MDSVSGGMFSLQRFGCFSSELLCTLLRSHGGGVREPAEAAFEVRKRTRAHAEVTPQTLEQLGVKSWSIKKDGGADAQL